MTVSICQLLFIWAGVVAYNIVAGSAGWFANITAAERFHECFAIGCFIGTVWIFGKVNAALTSNDAGDQK